jgi:pyruvate/2-oxoglutarate dehydrogenase complex dihydrolipoamide dehydrogenase (E3) component
MSEPQYDFIVIGGGSAGYAAACLAARLGLKTAVIEGGEEVGGLCILRGCMPSKTFLESGHRADIIRHAGKYGLRAEYHGADGAAIQARKRELVQEFADYRREQLETGDFDFIRGRARFTGPHTLAVEKLEGGRLSLEGKAFLIATGSRIKWHPLPGLNQSEVLTSDEVLASERIPRSVIVLGGGPTALEFASYYAGLGTKVTIIQRGAHFLRGMDSDVADALLTGLHRRGVEIFCRTELMRVEHGGAVKQIRFRHGHKEHTVEAEEIIYALGREPNASGLDLPKAGLELEKWAGVHAGSTQQTRVPHIFAAGDVCGPYEVVHIGIQQGEIAARNAARLLGARPDEMEHIDYTLKLFAVFTKPEVATVGLAACEAQELGIPFAQAVYPFSDHGKSMVRGETDGFVKLLAAGPERKLIGGAVVGPDASELIHEIVVAMSFGATAAQLAAIPHYHPTLSEIWSYPAEALAEADCTKLAHEEPPSH